MTKLASVLSVVAGLALGACDDSTNGTATDGSATIADGPTGAGGTDGGTPGAGGSVGAGGTAGTVGAGGTAGTVGAGGTAGTVGAGGSVGAGGVVGTGGTSGLGGTGGAVGGTGGAPPADCTPPQCAADFAAMIAQMCPTTGACMQQTSPPSPAGITISQCYANGVKQRVTVGLAGGGSITATVTRPDGVTPCYSFETTTSAGMNPPIIFKNGAGMEIFRAMGAPNNAITITCAGGTPTKTLAQSCGVQGMVPGMGMGGAGGGCTMGTCM
jgi:hypothetical protein